MECWCCEYLFKECGRMNAECRERYIYIYIEREREREREREIERERGEESTESYKNVQTSTILRDTIKRVK